jgi:hypothetical protein
MSMLCLFVFNCVHDNYDLKFLVQHIVNIIIIIIRINIINLNKITLVIYTSNFNIFISVN